MARACVRGIDRAWLSDLYRFAPIPHGVMYLKASPEALIPRVLSGGGFRYWESGLDFQEEQDPYKSFVRYQTRLLKVFDTLAGDYSFRVIDAERGIEHVFRDLSAEVLKLVADMKGVRG